MNFKEQQGGIIEYIENNYQYYLMDYEIVKPKIADDYIDFDKYKNDFILFIEYDSISFPQNRYNDDCSQTENVIINIFLVFRNDTPKNLNDKMLKASSAFFDMVRDERVDKSINCNINKIDFFRYIEGSNNIVSSKIILEMNKEI